ncbi:MAG: AAA family ATPase, partial [Desulfobacterales bacterium]|nr:AAA family ATPase [Desulfobacterales bacterium]
AMGYPGIATPSAADFEFLDGERLRFVNHIFLSINNTPEARAAARDLATRLGFKVRMLKWPVRQKRGYSLRRLALDKGMGYKSVVSGMIKNAKAFSPFSSPEKEHGQVVKMLEEERGKTLLGFETGLKKMDQALNGVRGINIMGGPPKAGKSCFFMQLSTEMARRKAPVIYYDFENGRQKIYRRTLSRISRLSDEQMRRMDPGPEEREKLAAGLAEMEALLHYFRVVNDRKLNPDVMRRQIDFLQHETRSDRALVVVDSLHKLPFKNLTERRTGIDSWLRNLEAIRDEQNVSFLVISELSRGEGGGYSGAPDLGSFKESGDIEYSADNAMILLPDWDVTDPISTVKRKSTLWMAASRENNPGKVADYLLDYPYWGFKEL